LELADQIQWARQTLSEASELVRPQEESMIRWKNAGVDPEVNTDYASSEDQWDREYRDLDQCREKQAAAERDLIVASPSRNSN
jgi:hypothetical protein